MQTTSNRHARISGRVGGTIRAAGIAAAAWLTALLLAGCATAPPPATPPATAAADAAFDAISRRWFDQYLATSPVAATDLGDHRNDGRLDDVSAEAQGRRADLARQLIGAIDALDRSRLSRPAQVDALLLRNDLQLDLWRYAELQDWRRDPLLYTGLAGSALYGLLARDYAPLPQRLESAGRRLAEFPRLLAQVRDVLEPARVPRIHAETAVRQNAGLLGLIDQLLVPQLGAVGEAQATELRAMIARARSAISQHQLWLEKRLLPEAKGDFRVGAALYDAKLRLVLDSTLTRADIRARAERELVRTRSEMYGIARTVLAGRPGAPALPESPDAEQQQAAIAAALALVAADRPAREQVFEFARAAFAEADRFVRASGVVTMHDDPIEIVPMPEFRRGVALAYCDAPGPLDRGQRTFYAISPIPADWTPAQVDSYLREYNSRSIRELTLHEAIPGHYVQLMYANRYPSPLRAVLRSGTFVEGWAVYGERLMIEQGFRGGDPLMRLVNLKWYLRAVANALLDQGVHVDGMTREQAMRLMVHDTFQEDSEATAKWVRAQLTATQLSTYFVGAQEHFALRDEARQRWGSAFGLRRYHDTALSFGSPPVRYVRALMFDLPID